MAFSEKIADVVLVKCGRFCCICHKFCGTNIELHHIVQQAEGGSDDEGNCIPLCFDCHAEVGHYNSHHPKGRKFTSAELKVHREKWFAKIAVGEGQRSSSAEELRSVDRDLLTELRSVLSYDGVVHFLKTHDFGAGFWRSNIEDIYSFIQWAKDPSHEFFDADLEAGKSSLHAAVIAFRDLISLYTWRERSSDTHSVEEDYWLSVPQEWEYKMPERYDGATTKLNDMALQVCSIYDSFVRLGRRLLATR